jgi:hypothetical protein
MSLTLWEYFWTEADWIPAPPATSSGPATVSALSSAGANGNDYAPKPDSWLEGQRATDEYWEEREKYIRRHLEPILREVIPLELEKGPQLVDTILPLKQDELFILQYKRNAMLRRAYAAQSEAELRKTADRVIKLSLDIRDHITQYYERAAIIILLDIF